MSGMSLPMLMIVRHSSSQQNVATRQLLPQSRHLRHPATSQTAPVRPSLVARSARAPTLPVWGSLRRRLGLDRPGEPVTRPRCFVIWLQALLVLSHRRASVTLSLASSLWGARGSLIIYYIMMSGMSALRLFSFALLVVLAKFCNKIYLITSLCRWGWVMGCLCRLYRNRCSSGSQGWHFFWITSACSSCSALLRLAFSTC